MVYKCHTSLFCCLDHNRSDGDAMRQMILIFLVFFLQDERNVFFNVDLESKFSFYVQCVVMCVISFFYAIIVQMDHGSLSIDKIRLIFGMLQIVNVILRFIMTYTLIEKEEYRRKMYKSSNAYRMSFDDMYNGSCDFDRVESYDQDCTRTKK